MQDVFKPSDNNKKVNFKLKSVATKNVKWVFTITFISFFISASLSIISSNLLENLHGILAFFIVLFIILVGIIFDIIGIAVTSAEEAPFHSMASRKHFGAKQSIKLIRNANKVSSICNDVVGDISGVISGTASAIITLNLVQGKNTLALSIISVGVTGLVAAITIGGKAVGKTFAIENSNYIVYRVGIFMAFFDFNRDKNKAKGRSH